MELKNSRDPFYAQFRFAVVTRKEGIKPNHLKAALISSSSESAALLAI
jgi:hypothetical protein